MAEHNDIGKIGENITDTFLKNNGFVVLERNYRTRHGEIDIIARKDNVLRFVEVKSVKVRDLSQTTDLAVKPEDNLTYSKWKKLVISTETYLQHRNIDKESSYQIDLACVYIDTEIRQGRVILIENVHKE
jgi:putative endonuclease